MPNLKLSNNACLERIRLGFLQVMMSQANIVFLIDVYFAVCLFVCLPVESLLYFVTAGWCWTPRTAITMTMAVSRVTVIIVHDICIML